MKPNTRATLFSAFVFPGVGQYLLKRYRRAILFSVISLVSLVAIIISSVQKALAISEKIIQQGIIPDVETITRMVNESSAGYSPNTINLLSFIILLCWFISILDAYLIKEST